MKIVTFVFALLIGTSAFAQDCKLTKVEDATSKTSITRTQEEMVINTAGRKWVYFMTNNQGQYTLHLKYNQTDMIFAVPKTSRLQLTATNGSTLAIPVKAGMEGEGRHFKGVKYWTVTLDFPLSEAQLAQLQTSDMKTMQLDFTKGQATMAVPEKKAGVFKKLAGCISQTE